MNHTNFQPPVSAGRIFLLKFLAILIFMMAGYLPAGASSGPGIKQTTANCTANRLKNRDNPYKSTGHFSNTWTTLDNLIGEKESVAIGDENGNIIFSKHADRLLAPASTLKILTALAAIHYFGEEFRFKTDLFLDKNNNLKIKGYGDPLFVSESIKVMAEKTAKTVKRLKGIVLDDTYFSKPITIPGRKNSLQPYDAPAGAICANFNTVDFLLKNGRYVSGEPQTPLVPFALNKIASSRLKTGRITLSENSSESLVYAGELIRHFLKKQNISADGPIQPGTINVAKDHKLLTYHSIYTMNEIVSGLLAHSNNFMANQLLLAAGAKEFGPPATLEKGVNAINRFAARHIGLKDFSIVEGSGLSKQNRLSTCHMLQILKVFEPYRSLMRQKGPEFYKTGTLKKVRTRAGFIKGKDGRFYRFAVFFNNGNGYDAAMKIIYKNLVHGYTVN